MEAQAQTPATTEAPRAPRNVAGAIYGQILASATVVALSLDPEIDTAEILGSLIGTMLVFWIAHGYAALVSEELERRRLRIWHDFRTAMAREWPLAQAATPAVISLLLGVVGVLERDTAVWLAIALGAANQFVWGLAVGRRSKLGWAGTLSVAAINCAFALVVIALKVGVH
jgi:hypothetical protein